MLSNFLKFDTMITPTIIKIVFWIGAGLSVLSGLGIIISGMNSYFGGGTEVLAGLITIVVGPFIVRMYCELLNIFFKMNESLQEIKRSLTNKEAHVTTTIEEE